MMADGDRYEPGPTEVTADGERREAVDIPQMAHEGEADLACINCGHVDRFVVPRSEFYHEQSGTCPVLCMLCAGTAIDMRNEAPRLEEPLLTIIRVLRGEIAAVAREVEAEKTGKPAQPS